MNPKIVNLFTWLLALLPITNIYGIGIPGISIGKILLIIVILIGLSLNTFKISNLKIPKSYLFFILFILFIPQFSILLFSNSSYSFYGSLYKSIGVLGYVLTFIFCFSYIDLFYMIKIYKKVVLICCLFFLFQELVNFFYGINIPGIIRGLPLSDTSDSDRIYQIQLFELRRSSVFLEPAHFAQYISSYLFFTLFYRNSESKLLTKEFVLITIVIILLRSGNGYFIYTLAMICWGIKMVYTQRKFIVLILSLSVLPYIAIKIVNSNNENIKNVLDRRNELVFNAAENTSGFQRIFRGYILYYEFSFIEKLNGIGFGNLESYIDTHPLYSYKSACMFSMMTYLNGAQYILIHGGLFSLILYILFLITLFKKNQTTGRGIVLLIILLTLISANYNTPDLLILTVFASLFSKIIQLDNKENDIYNQYIQIDKPNDQYSIRRDTKRPPQKLEAY